MELRRTFTQQGKSPYEGITFVRRTSRIANPDGKTIFEAQVIVPDTWDSVAVDILAQKYFRRKGCDFTRKGSVYHDPLAEAIRAEGTLPIRGDVDFEMDLRETIHRIVGCWTDWGRGFSYFNDDDEAQAFYDEMSYMMAHQMFAPNSPQWFNTGLHYAYGITGMAQGHYHENDYGEIIPSTNAYERPQTQACFIQSLDDDLVGENGIMDLWTREARLFKYGSGSGTNYSKIRGKGERLSGGGVSSGLMSFLAVGDRAAGAIKSGGTSRRAAKILLLDVDHPDIEEFVNWKVAEEHKVAMLVAGSKACSAAWKAMVDASKEGTDPKQNPGLAKAMREAVRSFVPAPFVAQCLNRIQCKRTSEGIPTYDLGWEGEAYSTVSAQNANNSVRASDKFMEAVVDGGMWGLKNRVDGKCARKVPAKDLWNKIVDAAWACGDPGIQFDDTFNKWNTVKASGRLNATNPCSEYAFLDNTACNLGSLNLMSFFKDGEFDVLTYISACGFATIALEITVAFSQYPTKEMARNSRDFRPLGLGYANAGALLMAMGMPYDSRWGRSVLAAISSITTGAAYRTSAAMAATMGPFPKFQVNRESVLEVLHMHRDGVYSASRATPTPLWSTSVSIWDDVVSMAQVNGVRNAQVTVVAPTGTISLLMGCDTSGIEPDFSLVKFKKLAGGGYLKIVNRGVEAALSSLDYSKEEIKDILGYALGSLIDDHTPGINFNDLLNEGFTPHTILKWIEALPGAFSPSFVLPVEDLQKRFGKERTDKFILAVGGHGNFEGAPHLRDEHLPIFDCASRTGVDGKRFISPRGHLLLMAAVQPFISGSISKTVNLPSDATPEDFSNIYMDAWKMGVKSIALYRDGSKLSQPLSTNMDMLDGLQGLEEDAPTAVKVETILKVMMDRKDDVETKPVLTRGTRLKLPGRRGGYTQAMSIGGLKCYLHAGEYEDGTLGEIFLDTHKEGAAFRSIMNCFAIAISIGLQYGVPLEEFCDAFLFTKFEPQGMVQGHPAVKMATSIIDCIFRDLAISYLGKTELAQVKPEELIKESGPRHPVSKGQVFEAATVVAEDVEVEQRMDSRLALTMGYTGDACPSCGNLTMVRNGTCTRCQTCGTTTGCS